MRLYATDVGKGLTFIFQIALSVSQEKCSVLLEML
jgi:hypothetical protein